MCSTGRKPCEHKGRDWSDESTSKRSIKACQKITGSQVRDLGQIFLSHFSEGTTSNTTLNNRYLHPQSVVLCYGSPRKPICSVRMLFFLTTIGLINLIFFFFISKDFWRHFGQSTQKYIKVLVFPLNNYVILNILISKGLATTSEKLQQHLLHRDIVNCPKPDTQDILY